MKFQGFTVSAFGHCVNREGYATDKLARPAVAYWTSLLENHGNRFQATIQLKGVGAMELYWNSEHLSCALATFCVKEDLLSTIVLVSGINAEADDKGLQMGQVALQKVSAVAGEEPGQDLLGMSVRPAVAAIRWTSQEGKTKDMLSDMEICLAAAFFERSFRASQLGL